MARKRKRVVSTKAFTDSTPIVDDLKDLAFLRALQFNFEGTYTVSGGSTDGTLVQDALLDTVLKNIRIELGGKQKINTKGKLEFYRRQLESGSAGVLVNPAVGVAANPCRVNVMVDLVPLNVRDALKDQFMWNCPKAKNVHFEVDCGDGSNGDMITGGDRTEVLTGTLRVIAHELVPTSGETYGEGQISVANQQAFEKTITAAQWHEFEMLSGYYYKRWVILVRDNSVRANTLVTDVELKYRGELLPVAATFRALQADNVEEYGVEPSSGDAPVTGLLIVEADPERTMRGALSTKNGEDLKLRLETGAPTGTAQILVNAQAIE